MMTRVQGLNRFMLLLSAPFLGMLLIMLLKPIEVTLPDLAPSSEWIAAELNADSLQTKLANVNLDAAATKSTLERYFHIYEQSAADAASMLQTSSAAVLQPGAIYDRRITDKLGRASRHASSGNVDLKLFALNEGKYQGYALKVTLKTDKAMTMALGKDKLGGSETTLEAVRRKGAIAGVNAGGFADDNRGRRFPLGTTMLNGQYVYGFFPSENNLTFIGLSKARKLIGGTFSSQASLDSLQPQFGATFVPVLLKGGQKQPIPERWRTSPARAARTVVGNYKDGQLLFIVTDGADGNGSSGATLAELQDKLLELGVRDAYNLDGGGSSTLIFDGETINRPADGKLRPLATNFLFFK